MKQESDKILKKIDKYYKNTEMLLELYLENYHNNYIYIRIDYYKKLQKYKLSWFDLKHYKNNFESIISYEYMPEDMINYIKDLITKLNNLELYKDEIKEKYKVNIKLGKHVDKKYQLTFNHYINSKDKVLYDLFAVIFDNLPLKLTCFFEETSAAITGNTNKYELLEEFEFDLFHGNLDILFDHPIKKQGIEAYEQGRVFFLEKFNDEYVAVVGGTSLYVVTIKYQEANQKMKISCSCPCEFYCNHLCAVLLAIRNNKFRKFYKITPKRSETSLLERVMNFKYLLSIGIDDQGNNYLVIEDKQLRLLSIVNKYGKNMWEILEDDEEGTLAKRINELDNNYE